MGHCLDNKTVALNAVPRCFLKTSKDDDSLGPACSHAKQPLSLILSGVQPKPPLARVQPKPPLAQFNALFSCPVTGSLGEEAEPHLATTSFKVALEHHKVSPDPPFP